MRINVVAVDGVGEANDDSSSLDEQIFAGSDPDSDAEEESATRELDGNGVAGKGDVGDVRTAFAKWPTRDQESIVWKYYNTVEGDSTSVTCTLCVPTKTYKKTNEKTITIMVTLGKAPASVKKLNWTKTSIMVVVLRPFADAAKMLEGEKYPTLRSGGQHPRHSSHDRRQDATARGRTHPRGFESGAHRCRPEVSTVLGTGILQEIRVVQAV